MLALLLVILLAAIICLKLLPVFSGTAPQFTDFIIEHVSATGLNKSGELTLFWLITAGGAVLLCVFLLLLPLITKHVPTRTMRTPSKEPAFHGSLAEAWENIKQSHIIRRLQEYSGDNHMLYLCAIVIPFPVYLMIYQKFSFPLFFGLLIVLFCFFSKKTKLYPTLFTYLLTYYAVLSVLSIGCHFTTRFQFSSKKIYALSILVGTVLVVCIRIADRAKKDNLFSQRILLLLQCFLPRLFSVYLIDKYFYQKSIIRVPYATGYYLFFFILATIFFIVLLYHLFRFWKEKKEDIICAVTPTMIYIYHSFCAAPMYAQPDQHHHGEQMIPWNQIFEHGQTAYETYTPVSGLFPFVSGFIQHVLLDGTISDYAPAISITMVIFCMLTMFLIYKHVGGSKALMFAVLFTLPCYNRQYMVLPLLLLLTLPKLIEKPLAWFFCYILGSFLAGLYYPLFGAAVLLAISPLAIWQAVNVMRKKSGQTKQSILYFAAYMILFMLIICSFPLLFRMLNHTLIYSSQTILADGIPLSNQTAPENFLPYLTGHQTIRHYLYMALRFLLPAIAIWLLLYFICLIIRNYQKLQKRQISQCEMSKNDNSQNDKITHNNQSIFNCLILLAGIITLVISYTYTLVRADIGKLLSRTGPILAAIIGIYLPVHLLSKKEFLFSIFKFRCNTEKMDFVENVSEKMTFEANNSEKVAFEANDSGKVNSFKYFIACKYYLFIGFCLSLPMLLYAQVSETKNPDLWVYPDGESQMVMDDGAKLFAYYTVPGTFLKSEDTGLSERYQELLGRGFMVADQIHYIEEYASVIEKCEKVSDDVSYMAFDGQGFFDYLGVKCYGTGYIPAARSLKAQQRIWNSNPDHLPVVFYIQPEYDYYIFRFMLDAGYVYCQNDNAFYPPDLYEKLVESNLVIQSDDYRQSTAPTDFGLSAASFGNSYQSFLDNHVLQEGIAIQEVNSIPKISYDALYLEFDDQKLQALCQTLCENERSNLQVSIEWLDAEEKKYDGSKVTCQYGDGKLLIPIGMNACWLLSDIDSFTINLYDSTILNQPPEQEQDVQVAQANGLLFSASFDQGVLNTSEADLLHITLHTITLDR